MGRINRDLSTAYSVLRRVLHITCMHLPCPAYLAQQRRKCKTSIRSSLSIHPLVSHLPLDPPKSIWLYILIELPCRPLIQIKPSQKPCALGRASPPPLLLKAFEAFGASEGLLMCHLVQRSCSGGSTAQCGRVSAKPPMRCAPAILSSIRGL